MYCDSKAVLPFSPSDLDRLGEDACPIDWALRVVREAGEMNCGKNVMCRDGTIQLVAIIRDITTGRGQPDDLDLIREICTVMMEAPGCETATKAASCVLASMDRFGDEWEAHCRRKRCPRMVCPQFYNLYIDPELCDGCGKCIRSAPDGAVEGGMGLVSVIRDDEKLKTAEFIASCPKGAIKKYGSVKPRIPTDPSPVGASGAAGELMGRRRRRGPSSE